MIGGDAWRRSDELSSPEIAMLRVAEAGEVLHLSQGSIDLAAMTTWGSERTIRATVLRHILAANEWPVHEKGIRLRGARVSGSVDLEGVKLRCPLVLMDCYFDDAGPVNLNGAAASSLVITGCYLAGLAGDMLVITKELDLSRSRFIGPVSLTRAVITGQISCHGTQLKAGELAGYVLVADRMKAGADILLDNGFTTSGAVRLSEAEVAGSLVCSGANLGTNTDGYALVADRMKVSADLLLNNGFTASGAVRLAGSEITGSLECRDARLTGADSYGDALIADGMKTGGDVGFYHGFTTSGCIQLAGAEITGSLICSGARLSGANADGIALFGDGVKARSVMFSDGFTASGAVRLAGSEITGSLECRDARLTGADSYGDALIADGMKTGGDVGFYHGFTTSGCIQLAGAEITGSLICSGARLSGANADGIALFGDGVKARSVMFSDGFTASHAVRLVDAQITGSLECRDAQLTGADSYGDALIADGMKTGGDMGFYHGFTTSGCIQLIGAEITGSLICNGAQLSGVNRYGNALVAERLKVSGDILLAGGFTTAGGIWLTRAEVTGSLECRDARLDGVDRDGNALAANTVKIGGDVYLYGDFAAAGVVSFNSAQIDGSMSLMPGRLAKENNDREEDRVAVDVAEAQITRKLTWEPSAQFAGLVSLENTTVGRFQCQVDYSLAERKTVDNGFRLRIEGFTYNGLVGQGMTTLEQRLAWIRESDFATQQPYEQLGRLYRETGQDTEARKVAIARRRDLRRSGGLSRTRKLGNLLLDLTIQYGYQTWRAIVLLAALYAAAVIFFWSAATYHNAFVPVQSVVGLQPVPTAANCTRSIIHASIHSAMP